jgi:hypothetical protein
LSDGREHPFRSVVAGSVEWLGWKGAVEYGAYEFEVVHEGVWP